MYEMNLVFVNLANPRRYVYAFKGEKLVTNVYNRISNFLPPIQINKIRLHLYIHTYT